ncbi:MAG TPA: 3-oxoacyl-ACP reductase FabG [Gammaproteobacteria bacterium]|nr:3-oxoacyl-ACP reductase FabG [Gammaproteobacteria bacterium]
MRLDGEVALVTGASRGIGDAIARRLAVEGARVIGTATTAAGAESISATLANGPPGSRGMVLDVSSDESVSGLFEQLDSDSMLPGILVNNAGITRDGLLARMSEGDWDAVLDTNLKALYRTCKAAARHLMRAKRGRIINITSVVGVMGNAGQVNYASAKAGMIGFTRALARELAPRNITVNAVAPGFIDTDMTRTLTEKQREALIGQIPLGRLGSGEDIASAAAFLASSGAGYITGEVIHVNGGLFMG